MIPPFAPLFKHMDGIAFAMRPRPGEYNPELNRLDPGNRSKFVNVVKSSLDSKSLMVSHYEPAISTAIPMVGGQIQLLVISHDAACLAQNSNSPRTQ